MQVGHEISVSEYVFWVQTAYAFDLTAVANQICEENNLLSLCIPLICLRRDCRIVASNSVNYVSPNPVSIYRLWKLLAIEFYRMILSIYFYDLEGALRYLLPRT